MSRSEYDGKRSNQHGPRLMGPEAFPGEHFAHEDEMAAALDALTEAVEG